MQHFPTAALPDESAALIPFKKSVRSPHATVISRLIMDSYIPNPPFSDKGAYLLWEK